MDNRSFDIDPHEPSPIRDRALFEAALDAQLVFDFDLLIRDQNTRHARMTGTMREGVVGRPLFEAFPMNPDQEGLDSRTMVLASLERIRVTGKPDRIPLHRHDLPRPGGGFETRYWEITHVPLVRNAKAVAVLQVSRDVTAQIVGNIRTEIEKRAAAAATGVTYFEYTPETDDFLRSPDVDAMFGYRPDEAGDRATPFFERVHPDDLPNVQQEVERVMRGEGPGLAQFDYRVIIPGREGFNHVRARGEVVPGTDGAPPRLVGTFIDRTEDVRLQERLSAALETRDAMMAEMNHRVKNSLQLASSVLRLHQREEHDPPELILEKARQRINAIALVHKRLYTDGKFRTIAMRPFLQDILTDLMGGIGIDRASVEVDYELCDLDVPTDRAVALGMVMTEFVTNAFKYGFSRQDIGELTICLDQEAGVATLRVINTGSDHDAKVSPRLSTRAGSQILLAFAKQLEGNLTGGFQDDGKYCAGITFPVQAAA
jgi:two-component sensor histidine kinase